MFDNSAGKFFKPGFSKDCIGQERKKQVLLSKRINKQFDRSLKIMHRFSCHKFQTCQLTYEEPWFANNESIYSPQDGEGMAHCDVGLNIQGFLPNSISKDAYQLPIKPQTKQRSALLRKLILFNSKAREISKFNICGKKISEACTSWWSETVLCFGNYAFMF